MTSPSMVHRSGDTLVVRSVVSGDQLFINDNDVEPNSEDASEDIEYGDEPADVDDNKNLPECKIRRNYSCNSCNYFTQNSRHYLYHLRDVHKEKVKIYECSNCLYASKHLQKLLRHTKMVHSSCDDFLSSDIGRNKVRKKRKRVTEEQQEPEGEHNMEEDMGGDDGGQRTDNTDNSSSKRMSDLKCSLCSFSTRHQGQLTRHEKQEHIKTKFFRCTKCSYVTHIKARFTKHVKYHSMPMIKCDLCDFRTPYKWNLDRHYKNHNGRGAFRCSACNFTADIKQSLTVHEMNHHVPPVGQAAGLGAVAARRRNKVGASDTTAAEEAAEAGLDLSLQILDQREAEQKGSQYLDFAQVSVLEKHPSANEIIQKNPKIKISLKKIKTSNTQEQNERHNFETDFIHPDDIIHHSNGNIYIKNKCKFCNFKSAWETEMARHERKVHNIVSDNTEPGNVVTKKAARPVPNLIPIQHSLPSQIIPVSHSVLKVPVLHSRAGTTHDQSFFKDNYLNSTESTVTEKELNDICAKSANSSLRDFASLFGDEVVSEKLESSSERLPNVGDAPDACTSLTKLVDTEISQPITKSTKEASSLFKKKNASFFDKLKAKLLTDAGEICNLTCKWCGHESKCLSELAGHQKTCGKEQTNICNASSTIHNISSTRCQYCRQRCKSSIDLHNHLQICSEANKQTQKGSFLFECEKPDITIKLEDDSVPADPVEPHPMENVVFVWNNIPQASEPEELDDHTSIDLSIRVQSPESENSFLDGEHMQGNTLTPQKMPTHGNDIDLVAEGRRVFKCPHCSFWATTASRFHVHIVGHLNKKPFECSLCAYRSNWRWDITKHIRLKSVRDPAHEKARVLMTDETGRRNYSKYNKYLTQMRVNDRMSDAGLAGRRSKSNSETSPMKTAPSNNKLMNLPKLTKAPTAGDIQNLARGNSLRPPPLLKAANKMYFHEFSEQKKRTTSESKKTLFKCKKCNFRHASRESILLHVKGHYRQENAANISTESDEASVLKSQAPFRCGHCHQVSNWKHVIQRHCRLKHSGDVRVVIGGKDGSAYKIEVDDQTDEPTHIDVLQNGVFKCKHCPYSVNTQLDYENHLEMHLPKHNASMKCYFCPFFVTQKYELFEHLKLHGVSNPEDYVNRAMQGRDPSTSNNEDCLTLKRYKCIACPYVSNSKSQFLYHKQFHRPRGAPFKCEFCSYNVTKRHLLHQHLRVHGVVISSPKFSFANGSDRESEAVDSEEFGIDEFEEVPSSPSILNFSYEDQKFTDIPLVWVSRDGKFSKMFKCRFCPHVNMRKVNIQEHEKMHSSRERNPNSSNPTDEHHCTECNYICNNAGVLSSHSKVHQGFHGQIHCLVNLNKSDEEQIAELTRIFNRNSDYNEQEAYYVPERSAHGSSKISTSINGNIQEQNNLESKTDEDNLEHMLYFCEHCPARFLNEKEFNIHNRFHGIRLFYRCEYCTYAARQRPHLLAHDKVHTDEYQEKTKILQNEYHTSKDHLPPRTAVILVDDPGVNRSVWVVIAGNDKNTSTIDYNENEENDNDKINKNTANDRSFNCNKCTAKFLKMEFLECHMASHENKNCKMQVTFGSVPLSGTELFQHKSEAQKQSLAVQTSDIISQVDPQFGTAMNGNPKFVYPTYLKNGRIKEKKYKCLKCPSAFEKREQYKVHLSLHGSKQKYKCENCDYSVKYYANYIQHMRKHQAASDAQAVRKSESALGEDYDEEEDLLKDMQDTSANSPFSKLAIKTLNSSAKRGPLNLTVAEKQTLMILQQRRVSTASSSKETTEEKKLFWCPHCPYTNYRRDAVDNHVNRHICVSSVRSNYTCDHCDYTVPQSHFLREHAKIHFIAQKNHQPDSYMICSNLNLYIKCNEASDNENCTKSEIVIFKDSGSVTKSGDPRFQPLVKSEVSATVSDNVANIYINPSNGEIVDNNSVSVKNDTKDQEKSS